MTDDPRPEDVRYALAVKTAQDRDAFIADIGLRSYDWALPQYWYATVLWAFDDENPAGTVVWCYDRSRLFGEPVAVTAAGSKFVAFYHMTERTGHRKVTALQARAIAKRLMR